MRYCTWVTIKFYRLITVYIYIVICFFQFRLNRVDDVIVFNSLAKEEIVKILDIRMKGMLARIADLGYTVQLTKSAKEFLADKGFDPDFGARPLQRALQKYLEEPLAEEVLKGELSEGDTIKVNHAKNSEELQVSKAKPKVEKTNKK